MARDFPAIREEPLSMGFAEQAPGLEHCREMVHVMERGEVVAGAHVRTVSVEPYRSQSRVQRGFHILSIIIAHHHQMLGRCVEVRQDTGEKFGGCFSWHPRS